MLTKLSEIFTHSLVHIYEWENTFKHFHLTKSDILTHPKAGISSEIDSGLNCVNLSHIAPVFLSLVEVVMMCR